MMLAAGQGYPGSVLSQVEIVVTLFYAGYLRYRKEPRDRLIVSKGHATMGIYPVLAEFGHFPEAELQRMGGPGGLLRAMGSIKVPGVEATTGSLGHGVGIGAGLALAAQRDGADVRVAVISSDGEMYEGSLWESALFAAHQRLDNLVLVIDRNRSIILGGTESLLPLEPVAAKWQAFGFRVLAADGHDIRSLMDAFDSAFVPQGRPAVVIAETVKGKGISFMENRAEWHYWRAIDAAQIASARSDLAEPGAP